MNGNQMNTECPNLLGITWLYINNLNIYDITGIEYFTNLEQLECSTNNLTSLSNLPSSLTNLNFNYNNLSSLPILPESLTVLQCLSNSLTEITELPPFLEYLNCSVNNITTLPELPETLTGLNCTNMDLSELPELPPMLDLLYCSSNDLNMLPQLPSTLTKLRCSSNNLTVLPQLPPALTLLTCNNNQLTCIPTLPMSLTNSSSFNFALYSNLFTCLPNYVPAMSGASNSQWLSFPLCNPADVVNNPYDCSSLTGITGTAFNDNNSNCEVDQTEIGVINAAINLLNEFGGLITTTFTFGNANYNFVTESGNYTVQLVTENMPFQASCVNPGTEQNVVLTIPSPSALNVDFGLECLPGYDVGVQSVVTTGWVFPGQEHIVNIVAGDMSSWYGLQCVQGVGGTLTVYVDGPVSYVGPAVGSFTPSASGDLQFTYDIADFSLVNFQEDFGLRFQTDTTAQAGELICVDIIVNPIDDDLNPANNTFNYCYEVVNSYDPNIKQVWPQNVEPGFDGYFNYTIYFQNTGTAPAFNIRLADTLDTNLDLSTFQVTNYSHPVLTYLHGNVLTFRFNNIMLPDSTTDLEGSIGFVQYRIKPIAGLPVGTVIENTAHIFFDFNDAIVTNTTVNEYMIPTSLAGLAKQNNLMLFPNPASGLFTIEWNNQNTQSTIEVFNMNGVRVLQKQSYQNREVMDLSTYPAGVYMVRVSNSQSVMQTKLIKR